MVSNLATVAALRRMIDTSGRTIDLEVDGGVKPGEIAADVVAAGADVLVAGSAVFGGDPASYAANIANLRNS